MPYNVDVPMQRWPLMNWAIMLITVVISAMTLVGIIPFSPWMVIGPGDDFSFAGLFGSLVTHADFMHLAGNMLFLFVFGNAVNAKIGHLPFLGCYALIGMIEGLTWSLLAGGPALGASGAIMGVIGMFVVFYPRNDVSVGYWIFYARGSFEISSYVVICAYFALDIWGMLTDGAGVAYLAHVAGLLAGFTLASGLVLAGFFPSDDDEENLYEALGITER
jgi:membrane associated rhomboid family serine protease